MARKVIPNPKECPVTHFVNIMGGRWKWLIIYLLSRGSMRFGKLVFMLPSISRKVLTDQLKELEADGLITRRSFPETPPRVEYSLTPKAQELLPAIRMFSDWVVRNYPDIPFEECWVK